MSRSLEDVSSMCLWAVKKSGFGPVDGLTVWVEGYQSRAENDED